MDVHGGTQPRHIMPGRGPCCMGTMRLAKTPIQVKNEQNSTASRTCGMVAVSEANSGRAARSAFAGTDEQIPKKSGSLIHTVGISSRP